MVIELNSSHDGKLKYIHPKVIDRNSLINYGKSLGQIKNNIKDKYKSHKKNRPNTVCGLYSKLVNENLCMRSNKLLKLVDAKLVEATKESHHKKQ